MVAESDISVAVVYPGGRSDRITKPLFNTDMDVAVEPSDTYDRDIVMLDNADIHMWKPIVKSRNRNTKVIYRIRGDMLRAYREMNMTPYKYYIAKSLIGKVDGAVSIEKVLAERFTRTTGVSPVGLASLCKDPNNWPSVAHFDEELRCITLTNANYMGKIQPLIEYAPIVNNFFKENSGYWTIYGKGNKEGYLADNLADYENVHYKGHTDKPKAALSRSNLMLHFSQFDSMPNAILEGMACNLPVITNPYSVFSWYGKPLVVRQQSELADTLSLATRPGWRVERGHQGLSHLRTYHTSGQVGKQYVSFFRRVLE